MAENAPERRSLPQPSANDRFMLSLAGAVLFFLAAAKLAAYIFARGISEFDDAYMFLRYARNLLEGHGIAWNPGGPQTFGATALLYLFELAAIMKISGWSGNMLLPLMSFTHAIGACFMIAAVICKIIRFSWLKNVFFVAGLLASWLLMHPDFRYHAWTGMDTTLAVMINAALVYAGVRLFEKPNARNAALTALIAYLSYLCRLDNLVYAVLFPALGIMLLAPSGRVKALLVFAAVFGALAILDTGAKFLVFGDIVPLPVYVKRSGFYSGFYGSYSISSLKFFNAFLGVSFPFLMLLFLGRPLKQWKAFVVFLLPAVITSAALFQAVQIMGSRGRFFIPALPFVAAGAVYVFDRSFGQGRMFSAGAIRRLLVSTAFVLLVGQLLPSFFSRSESWFLRRQMAMAEGRYDKHIHSFLIGPLLKNNAWTHSVDYWWNTIKAVNGILKKLPEGTVVAATEHGYLSAENPSILILDMNGLHETVIARRGFSAGYVLSQKPDLIWLPHWDYTGSIRDFWKEPGFWTDYEYYPRAFLFGIAIRKNGPHYETIKAAVADSWPSEQSGLPMASELTHSYEDLKSKMASWP